MRVLIFLSLIIFLSSSSAEILQNITEQIQEEWDDATLKANPKLKTGINVGSLSSLTGQIGYSYTVTPAYVQDRHQRIDSYGLKLGAHIGQALGAGRSAEAQISFSQLFNRKNQALFAAPKSPRSFPFTAETALLTLARGSAARLELATDGHIGASFMHIANTGLGTFPAQFSGAVRRGTRYIIDVYRVDQSRVRVRMVATRNMGSFGVKTNITPLTSLNFGLGFVDNILNKLFRCDLISIEGEKTATNKLPVDSMMVDYVFFLDSPLGENTYNRFFEKVLSMDVLNHLRLFQTPEQFYASVWDYAQIIDDAYQKEKLEAAPQYRIVQREFKGRTLTDFRKISIGSGCFKLWDVDQEVYHATTGVRSFNDQDATEDYFYLGTQKQKEFNFLFGLFDEEHSLQVNTLFRAQRENPQNPLSLKPIALSDLVLNRSFKDKKFLGKGTLINEIRTFRRDLEYQYPQFFSNIDWSQYVNTKQLAYSKVEMIFDARSVALLRQKNFSEEQLKTLLQNYIGRYPSKNKLSTTGGGKHHDPKEGFDRFAKDTATIARRLTLIFKPGTTVEMAVKAFSSLRKNPLFQDVGAGFILTLLPQEQVRTLVEATLTIGAKDTPTIEVVSKSAGMSHLYKEVEHILNAINDRSFDLRLHKEIGPVAD